MFHLQQNKIKKNHTLFDTNISKHIGMKGGKKQRNDQTELELLVSSMSELSYKHTQLFHTHALSSKLARICIVGTLAVWIAPLVISAL